MLCRIRAPLAAAPNVWAAAPGVRFSTFAKKGRVEEERYIREMESRNRNHAASSSPDTSSQPVPQHMRALRLHDADDGEGQGRKAIVLEECDVPSPGPGEALVRVSHAALNHRDNWITMGMYPKIQYGGTLGSDGAGHVVRTCPGDTCAEGEADAWLGQRVVIDPTLGWGARRHAPSAHPIDILGMPSNGTLAEYVCVPLENLRACPAHLTDAEAAALPLAGGTAYRALVTKGGVGAAASAPLRRGGVSRHELASAAVGQSVLVTGVGGGVALFALQLSVAMGAHVVVTSGSDDKLRRAADMGAAAGVNYAEEGWEKSLRSLGAARGGFDCVVDGAGGAGLNAYLKAMRPGGSIVSYGVTAGLCKNLQLPLAFLSNVDVKGTAMCGPDEFSELMELVRVAGIRPVVDSVHAADNFADAMGVMRAGTQFGKICVDMDMAGNR